MSECRMSFVAVTSAQILGQRFCSLSTDALNLLLDIVQLCAHATADSFDQAGEFKWQQACSSDLLRIPQPADLHLVLAGQDAQSRRQVRCQLSGSDLNGRHMHQAWPCLEVRNAPLMPAKQPQGVEQENNSQ